MKKTFAFLFAVVSLYVAMLTALLWGAWELIKRISL